jgi:hypothetical protein
MINPVLPISSEEISYKSYDLIFLYDTKNLFFACLVWWVYNYEITNKILEKHCPNEVEVYIYTWIDSDDDINTKMLDYIIDILDINY